MNSPFRLASPSPPQGAKLSGKRSAKLLLAQQKASTADLERRLQAAQARLANQPSQPSQVQPDDRELAEALRLSEQEAAEAAGERDMLRGELQEAALAAEAIPREAALLVEELQKTERAEAFWRKELEQVQELRCVLESSVARCQEEAASEAAESLRLRKYLEDRGCGLSWLRSIARSHVEDLQGSVTSLDLHLQPALQAASLGSNDG